MDDRSTDNDSFIRLLVIKSGVVWNLRSFLDATHKIAELEIRTLLNPNNFL